MSGVFDPIIYKRRTGLVDDPYFEYNNAPYLVSGSKVILQELPDMGHRVYINGLNETLDVNPQPGKFYVDYRTGIITFNENADKTTVLISYFGAGVTYYPAERIYTKVDDFGEVVENLADSINQIQDVSETVADLSGAISNAEALETNLNNGMIAGTELKNNLDTAIINGNIIKNDLTDPVNGAIKRSDDARANLNSAIINADTTKTNLDNSISSADLKKSELNTSIGNANLVNDALSNPTTGSIKRGTDINTSLNTKITEGTTLVTDLNTTIPLANTAKTNLDGSIVTGTTLKGELDAIITGTDFETVIPDINSLKLDQHNHTNKTVLDKFSEENGDLKYNSQDIGSMSKSVYDTNNDGKVDISNDSEKLGGQLPSYYAKTTDIPDVSVKADITYVDSGLAGKVNNSRVLTDVPDGAIFTDTIYTHPTGAGNNHMPTGGTPGQILKNIASGVATWQADNDTITTINSKTGAISKDDIVALGIPAQDTIYTHPGSGTNPHGTTKSDVGLSEVSNVKQLPDQQGELKSYIEALYTLSTTSESINTEYGNVYSHVLTGNTTYTNFTNATRLGASSFTLIITQPATVYSVIFPTKVKWQNNITPDLSAPNKIYLLTFISIDQGTTWLGMSGGFFNVS